jgi:hypothetical protein
VVCGAGPWLKYRGNLDYLSNNTLIGAVNAESGAVNAVTNVLTPERSTGAVPDVARAYQSAGLKWVVIGEDNYGIASVSASAHSRACVVATQRLFGAFAQVKAVLASLLLCSRVIWVVWR